MISRSSTRMAMEIWMREFTLSANPKWGAMKLILASISTRGSRAKSEAADALARDYTARAARLEPTELVVFADEATLLAAALRDAARRPARPAALLLLLDSRGETLTSEQFAEVLGRARDSGMQRVLLGIGPADGWSAEALGRASRVFSLGRMTMPHELARAVLAEQVYRALPILAGHPYPSGH